MTAGYFCHGIGTRDCPQPASVVSTDLTTGTEPNPISSKLDWRRWECMVLRARNHNLCSERWERMGKGERSVNTWISLQDEMQGSRDACLSNRSNGHQPAPLFLADNQLVVEPEALGSLPRAVTKPCRVLCRHVSFLCFILPVLSSWRPAVQDDNVDEGSGTHTLVLHRVLRWFGLIWRPGKDVVSHVAAGKEVGHHLPPFTECRDVGEGRLHPSWDGSFDDGGM